MRNFFCIPSPKNRISSFTGYSIEIFCVRGVERRRVSQTKASRAPSCVSLVAGCGNFRTMSLPVDEEEPRSLTNKLAEVPCLRSSYLYGISAGIGTGLAYFMFSSRPGLSTHAGFTGFVVTTIAYWMYCRHNWSKNQEQARMFRELLSGELAAESLKKEGPPVSVSSTKSAPAPTNL